MLIQFKFSAGGAPPTNQTITNQEGKHQFPSFLPVKFLPVD